MAALDEMRGVGRGSSAHVSTRLRRVTIGLAATLILLVAGIATYLFTHSAHADDVASQVNARISQLGVKQAALDPTLEKALRVRRAIVAGDFASAGQTVADVLASSQIQNWRFYPYEDFVTDVFIASPADFGDRLDQWVAEDGGDAAPLLLRAQYHHDSAWAKRGHAYVDKTSPAQMTAFVDETKAALADIDAALKLDPGNPYGFYLRIAILSGGGWSQAVSDAFAEGVGKFPAYYPLYDRTLDTLQPRWGGTIGAMSGFVDKYAGEAPQDSPRKLLYLSLYRDVLSTGSAGCSVSGGDADQVATCTASFVNRSLPVGLEQHVVDALGLYDHTDKYQFGLAVRPIISDMLASKSEGAYAGAVLQLASTAMHSDTQLKQESPGHNDHVIDELVAESWEDKGFLDNATTKYTDALADVQSTSFPSDAEKNAALGHIYDSLSKVSEQQNKIVEQIAFEKAAVLVGWPWDADRICHGYYQLKDYDQAVTACTEAIELTDDTYAWYWRGEAHNDSGQKDLALEDLKRSADLGGYFAPYAAVDMSMIYFNRGDNLGALDVLNRYPSLYDANQTAAAQIAVGYNNRCYAYMELGDLQKALDDCTQSLKYGSIPDAFRKQQELVAQLKPTN